MLPPKLEICIEGYNTEQVDFYINQLMEKINSTSNLYEKSLAEIKRLEEENNNLRKDFISLVSQFNSWSELQNNVSSICNSLNEVKSALNIETVAEPEITEEVETEFTAESDAEPIPDKAEDSVIGEVESLQRELFSLKELLKK